MSRLIGLAAVLVILVGAMGFAAANAGHYVTLNLGLFTLYRVPVTFVAFSGLLTGMVVMFLTGVRTDLKVRRILRERLSEEAREEKTWFDKNQQDLFTDGSEAEAEPRETPASLEPTQAPRRRDPLSGSETTSGVTPNNDPPLAHSSSEAEETPIED